MSTHVKLLFAHNLMTVSTIRNPKCLIVDDEIASNPLNRQSFLKLIDIPSKNAIFASNYDSALQLIKSDLNIVFCFLDCRIPKNSQDSINNYQNNSQAPKEEWGLQLIPEFKDSVLIFIYSAYVSLNYLLRQSQTIDNIIGCSDKTLAKIEEVKQKFLSKFFKPETEAITNADSKFDYTSLDQDVAVFVQDRTNKIKRLARNVLRDLIEIGSFLIEIKEKLGHGNFINWLKTEFPWRRTSAYQFMQTASRFECSDVEHLSILPSALMELSSVSMPDEVVDEILERSSQGEKITRQAVKAAKKEYIAQQQERTIKEAPTTKKAPTTVFPAENKEELSSSTISSFTNTPPRSQPTYEPPKPEILSVQHNTIKNSYWQLNNRHRLFCGEPSSPLFLKLLPDNIASVISYFPNGERQILPFMSQAKANLCFDSEYDDLDEISIKKMSKQWFFATTDPEDLVVLSRLFHLQLLDLVEEMNCSFYLAEPDLDKCELILATWRQKGPVSRLSVQDETRNKR